MTAVVLTLYIIGSICFLIGSALALAHHVGLPS